MRGPSGAACIEILFAGWLRGFRAAARVAPSALVNELRPRGRARNALVNGETGAHRVRQLGPGVNLHNENPTLLALGKKAGS